MKALNITALLVLFTGHSFAQTAGFYGRTFFLELHAASQYPLINNIINNGNYSGSSTITGGVSDNFNTSVNAVFGKAISSKVSLSAEVGLFFGSFIPQGTFYYEFSELKHDYFTAHELFNFRTLTIMPKIEISGEGGNAPGGLSHQIGIGFTSSSVVEKDYAYTLGSTYTEDSLDFSKDVVNYDYRHKGISLMYALVMRVPINRRLLFNYGFRYNMNFKLGGASGKNPNTWQSDAEAEYAIGRTRGASVLSFQAGFTFVL